MTLDEAIRHHRDVAGEKMAETVECASAYDRAGAKACHEEYMEHKQLAEWLEELQQRRGRAAELAALEDLRQLVNETGRVRGIGGTVVESVRPCVATGVRAAIQTLIDMTNEEASAREEEGRS